MWTCRVFAQTVTFVCVKFSKNFYFCKIIHEKRKTFTGNNKHYTVRDLLLICFTWKSPTVWYNVCVCILSKNCVVVLWHHMIHYMDHMIYYTYTGSKASSGGHKEGDGDIEQCVGYQDILSRRESYTSWHHCSL